MISICPWICSRLLDCISKSSIDCYVINAGSICRAFPGVYSPWMVLNHVFIMLYPCSAHHSIYLVPLSYLLPGPYCPTMSSKFPSPTFTFHSPITRVMGEWNVKKQIGNEIYRFASVMSPQDLSVSSYVPLPVGTYICVMLMLNILPRKTTNMILSDIAQ